VRLEWCLAGEIASGSSTIATQLGVVAVTIMAPEECYNATDIHGEITENVICVGVSNCGKEACQGVFGRPVAVCGQLVGTVSW
jgi:secreted trypsin-like serine protease